MDSCTRCDRGVDGLQTIPPDVITKELIDSIDHGEKNLAGGGTMVACADCMDTPNGD